MKAAVAQCGQSFDHETEFTGNERTRTLKVEKLGGICPQGCNAEVTLETIATEKEQKISYKVCTNPKPCTGHNGYQVDNLHWPITNMDEVRTYACGH